MNLSVGYQELVKGKPGKPRLRPDLFLACALLLYCGLPITAVGQKGTTSAVDLTKEDIESVITCFESADPTFAVRLLRKTMPEPVTDENARALAHRMLPQAYVQLQIADPQLEKTVRKTLEPVLSLYGRTQAYDIVLIHQPTPLIMTISGVILLLTTGFLERMANDDDLLGAVAHEIGHEYFLTQNIASAHLFSSAATNANPPLRRKAAEALAIIELECDAFAALTVAALGRNPLESIKSLERDYHDFPDASWLNHPTLPARRAVVSGVVPPQALRVPPIQSETFKSLGDMLGKVARKN